MNVYLVLLNLIAAIMLLLWSVRMVQTGIQRSQEALLVRLLRESGGGKLRAVAAGTVFALALQSSTAVGLLAADFAASGTLGVSTSLALMLGADLGSALVVQVLSLGPDWLMPVLLAGGGAVFFNGRSRNAQQYSRVLFGVALILMSLGLIGDATAPLREASLLPGVIAYLENDAFTAFLTAAVFTWLVRSSVAAVLLIATFAAAGMVPAGLGVALILGANLGEALASLGIAQSRAAEARRIALGNAVSRGSGTLLALLAFQLIQPSLALLGPSAMWQLLNLHVVFNLGLIVVGLPLIADMADALRHVARSRSRLEPSADVLPGVASCLDYKVAHDPGLALASATRELLRMAATIERMFNPLMDLYRTGDRDKILEVRHLEESIDRAQAEIKRYVSQIRYSDAAAASLRRGQDLASVAINFEYAGDAISKDLLSLVEERHNQQLKFSPAGWNELTGLHQYVLANMRLALNVLVSRDTAAAVQLVASEAEMRRLVESSQLLHLARLQRGGRSSIDTSNIHLETLRALKNINSYFAATAYPVLSQSDPMLPGSAV